MVVTAFGIGLLSIMVLPRCVPAKSLTQVKGKERSGEAAAGEEGAALLLIFSPCADLPSCKDCNLSLMDVYQGK